MGPWNTVGDCFGRNTLCDIVAITANSKLDGQFMGCVKYDTLQKELGNKDGDKIRLNHITAYTPTLIDELTNLQAKKEIAKGNSSVFTPVINSNQQLVGFFANIENISTDNKGKLLVGASIGTDDEDKDRLELLVKACIDLLILEPQSNWASQVLMLKFIKTKYPSLEIIPSNVTTQSQAKMLIDADGLKVGDFSGASSTCRRSLINAIFNVSKYSYDNGIPVIADGLMLNISDLIKALALGASAVIIDSMAHNPENEFVNGANQMNIQLLCRKLKN